MSCLMLQIHFHFMIKLCRTFVNNIADQSLNPVPVN